MDLDIDLEYLDLYPDLQYIWTDLDLNPKPITL